MKSLLYTSQRVIFFGVLFIVGVAAWIFSTQNNVRSDVKNFPITTFEECVAAGNPIMESYPRRCSINGATFTEDILE